MLVVKPGPEIEFSEKTLARMPPMFAEIVRHQHELEDYCSEPVVDMKTAERGFTRRNFLAREAEKAVQVMRGPD